VSPAAHCVRSFDASAAYSVTFALARPRHVIPTLSRAMNALEEKQEAVNQAGAQVRALKAQGAAQDEITAAIDALKQLKVSLEAELTALKEAGNVEAKAKEEFRAKLSTLLEGRMFYVPSFKIYGGVAGLYDYGPPGCAVKANVQQFWRQHFVLEESMLELECPAVTPEAVLRASG
jgi:glycyl-tRNA synthetase